MVDEGDTTAFSSAGATATADVLVAGHGSLAADFAAYSGRRGAADLVSAVIFLPPRLDEHHRREVDDLLAAAAKRGARMVCVVSTFRALFGDRNATAAEAHALRQAAAAGLRTVLIRPGHVLSPGSPDAAFLRRFGFCWPLVPSRLRSCFVEGGELFAAVEAECRTARRGRELALLGPNRPWRDVLRRHRAPGLLSACLTAACALLSLLLLGHLAALVLDLLARRRSALRRWNCDTLRPGSFRELLALCNRHNHRHVKVVGYNNGVVHFGQRFPGRTVVSTVRLNRVVRTGPDVIRADCGVTVRQALAFLAADGQELPVIPNYSYVCLGTAFFVPIHGSAADFSCVAETITRVVLYDPVSERLIVATRDEAAFRDNVYDMKSGMVLLRLDLRVRPRARYFVRREELEAPDATAILAALRDDKAANVEVRKSSAAARNVSIIRFYTSPDRAGGQALELPRDPLGSLWDKLEANAVTSYLFHLLVRRLAWHVELFFPPADFVTFWETHQDLPLRKIQLRSIRRDGLPKSPFRDGDCVSVDLFMLRRHRRPFEAYLRRTFAAVRVNPGKHSM
jgi:hypothetical protein